MSFANFTARASLSTSLSSSPSVFRLFAATPSSAGCHPLSARTTDWRPVLCCLWCPDQCPNVWGFAPPTCAAGGTWLGCGWRGIGDDAPPMVLRSSMRLAIPTGSTEVSSALLTPLDHLGARLCLPPPPPLPLSPYNRTCPNTLPTNGRVFSWSPRSPSPCRSPLAPDPSTS